MVYTVTFNPALDYVVRMDGFRAGDINRTQSEEIQFGGKGINVSTVLRNLGVQNVAMGFLAGFTGQALERRLRPQTPGERRAERVGVHGRGRLIAAGRDGRLPQAGRAPGQGPQFRGCGRLHGGGLRGGLAEHRGLRRRPPLGRRRWGRHRLLPRPGHRGRGAGPAGYILNRSPFAKEGTFCPPPLCEKQKKQLLTNRAAVL